jgi:hypothetical protein
MINDLWYKNAVIYCLSVGTYIDADGDGTGDFRGLMRRLDYLQGLGVTAIWLMPFQTSPCRDDSYDVADYYNVAWQGGFDLISNALPVGRLWYDEPDAISNAVDYAKFFQPLT